MSDDGFLSTSQAAAFLGLSIPTLERHRTLGSGPRFYRLGTRAVKYRRVDLLAWAKPAMSTSEAAEDLPHGDR